MNQDSSQDSSQDTPSHASPAPGGTPKTGLTPREIVSELDRYIVGQTGAKRAVAIAIRNRWRRQRISPDFRDEVTPKNIVLIGPTGVGKTEIARRLASLVGAPFIKVEATTYTQVGYVGRDVESIIRDLADKSRALVRREQVEGLKGRAEDAATEALLDALLPPPDPALDPSGDERRRYDRTRDKFRRRLLDGELDDRKVEIETRSTPSAPPGLNVIGGGLPSFRPESFGVDLQGLFKSFASGGTAQRSMTVREARKVLLEQRAEDLVDEDALNEEALRRARETGIVFIDEIDKVAAGAKSGRGPDVSGEGVQRDLLPIVEGTTVQTRLGPVRTDHILFIAAGAFHVARPSDLIPELQGRFPIRVELSALGREELLRILTEPRNALTRQYEKLLATEGVTVEFKPEALEEIAKVAEQANSSMENIGARRLHTIMEQLLDQWLFEAPDRKGETLSVDLDFVKTKLEGILADEDLSRFIL